MRGRFEIAPTIMARCEIYGQTERSAGYRHLFIVTRSPLFRDSLTPSVFLSLPLPGSSSLIFFIARTRERAFNARPPAVSSMGTRLRTIECNFVHRHKNSVSENLRLHAKADLHARNYVMCSLLPKLSVFSSSCNVSRFKSRMRRPSRLET